MPTQSASLRRRRSEIEDDEDGDVVRSSQRSTPSTLDSSKRARTNGHVSDTPSESSEPEDSTIYERQRHSTLNRGTQNGSPHGSDDGDDNGPSKFQPGSIKRVKVKDFVTYTAAEFFPGPNLNMVIGPNGTGKSSLVCAICLGLGWSPTVLGRGDKIGEFVKHGHPHAMIEIELQCRDNEPKDHVIGLKIIRDGNGREWYLNGKKTSLKAIQTLTRSLSIQIDNLCQFLPQDKVSEFAALSPVELLQQTQRAAAPEQMLEWHDKLKELRQEQKQYEEQITRDNESLNSHERWQEGLQAEVDRLRQRQHIQEKIAQMKKTIHVVDYNTARKEHKEYKRDKRDAMRQLAALEAQVEPTLQSINRKHEYAKKVKKVIAERKNILKSAEGQADELLSAVEKLDDEIVKINQKRLAETKITKRRKEELYKLEKKLKDLETKLESEPVEFNGAEWNEKIRAKDFEGRKLKNEIDELKSQIEEGQSRGRELRRHIDQLNQELRDLNSQEGQQMDKIAGQSNDTAKAWKWIQENQDKFEKEIYGPPLVTCSLKDPRYADVVESLLSRGDVVALSAQTPNDFKKLSDALLTDLKLGDITLRSSFDPVPTHRILSAQDLQLFGLDGFALDYVDGPEPVLAMLRQLHGTAVALRDITDEQFHRISKSHCTKWVAGRTSYNISKRAEYGADATSTSTRSIKAARYWTGGPVDTGATREIEDKIKALSRDFEELRDQVRPARERGNSLVALQEKVAQEMNTLKEEKAVQQRAYGEYMNLPQLIERQKEAIEVKKAESKEGADKMHDLGIKEDHATIRKAKASLTHKEQIERIRSCHEQLLDAEIRLIEANSDIEALEERNQGTVQKLEMKRQKVQEVQLKLDAAFAKATRLADVVREIMADTEPDAFKDLDPDLTVEMLETKIRAEENQLEFIHASNPNAIREFEKRQHDIDKLKAKVDEAKEKLHSSSRRITKIRGKWEPELDKLIAEISDAFSFNFEQIGCAGEVGVHKDEDFDQWSIQIKVKFRENETLQILDQHRQSGGERSVSTIFYLLSLQSLARSPFRVVDEINQGMDPRNERMVHERMVEIACKEHTSQYFLITPKLLTNLRYDRRMKVHCITSGEYMPVDHTKMDVRNIVNQRRDIKRRAMVAAR